MQSALNFVKRWPLFHGFLSALLLTTLMTFVRPHWFWSPMNLPHYPIHSTIEAFGAFAAIVMALLSTNLLIREHQSRYIFISAGLLAMGLWDLFHAASQTGTSFVLTHSLSLLFGGIFFSLIWFHWPATIEKSAARIKISVAVFVLLGASFVALAPDMMPAMIIDGGFSPTAKAINLLAAVLFLLAFFRLYVDFYRSEKIGFGLLVAVAFLSAIAGFVFPLSTVWSDDWWFWHLIRLISFLFVLGFMIVEYRRVLEERKRSAERIKEQSLQIESLFNGIDDAVYVSDPDTFEILYFNETAQKTWGSDFRGKKCYETVQNRESPCPFCTNDRILKKKGTPVVWEFQNEVTGTWYRCVDKAIRWTDGKWVRFEMAVDISDAKAIEKRLLAYNAELEAFNTMAVGREIRMIELKETINQLSRDLGKEAPYDTSFADQQ